MRIIRGCLLFGDCFSEVLASLLRKRFALTRFEKKSIHHISSHHFTSPHYCSSWCIRYTHTFASHWHHIGSPEEIQEQEIIQEGELLHLGVHPDGGSAGDGQLVELPECPNHYLTTYVKGKPRSIAIPYPCFLNLICCVLYMFDALSLGMFGTVDAYTILGHKYSLSY